MNSFTLVEFAIFTVMEVNGEVLMLAGKLSVSQRAINGGTCGHPSLPLKSWSVLPSVVQITFSWLTSLHQTEKLARLTT